MGTVLDEIESLGLTNNTIVAVVSDHGYALGELNRWVVVWVAGCGWLCAGCGWLCVGCGWLCAGCGWLCAGCGWLCAGCGWLWVGWVVWVAGCVRLRYMSAL